jgi:hypothetical protein
MKRNILDITQTISRKPGNAILTPYNLKDSTYWIFEAKGWRFKSILREIEFRETQNRLNIHINTQNISPKDYIAEDGPTGLLIKFIKNNFEMYIIDGNSLDGGDFIEIKGDIEKYA